MALYQYSVELIPTRQGAASDFPGEDDIAAAWAGYSRTAAALATEIDTVIPRANAWCDGLARWGDDATDELQLWEEGGRICSLTARFDCRDLSSGFFRFVAWLAVTFGLSVALRDSRLVVATPTADQLRSAAQRSVSGTLVATAQGGSH